MREFLRRWPAAALATIRKIRSKNVPRHLKTMGEAMRAGWRELSQKHGVAIEIEGVPALSVFKFAGKDSQAIRTLFTQEMLVRGILASHLFYPTLAHTRAHIAQYLKAADEVFALLADAIRKGEVHARLKGPVAHTGFQRLN